MVGKTSCSTYVGGTNVGGKNVSGKKVAPPIFGPPRLKLQKFGLLNQTVVYPCGGWS